MSLQDDPYWTYYDGAVPDARYRIPLDPIVCLEIVNSERWQQSIVVTDEGCWLRRGAKRTYKPYSMMRIDGRAVKAHRIAWVAANGLDVPSEVIDHTCGNPPCVNPDHLDAISNRENVLRGTQPMAQQARQTHCKHGHPLVEGNLRKTAQNGHRQCVTCSLQAAKEQRQALKAAANVLGMSQRKYTATYGFSAQEALEVVRKSVDA